MSPAHEDTQKTDDRALLPERYSFVDGEPLRILGSRSEDTGSLYWPPRLRCPRTGGLVEEVDLPTGGVIWSWTFVQTPWPGVEHPNGSDMDGYGVGIVDLDDNGPRVPAVLVGKQQAWTVGDRVRACELPFITVDGAPKSILAFKVISS